jgi:plastocyanin
LAFLSATRHPASVRRFPPAALVALVAALALVLAGCGDDGGGGGGGGRSAGTKDEPVTEFTIVAEDLRFDLDRIVVPAGTEVTATIDNRDDGVGHNLSVALPDGEAETDVEAGPVEQTLRFTVPEPGEYDFVCDPHAATMKGVVEAVSPGPGG